MKNASEVKFVLCNFTKNELPHRYFDCKFQCTYFPENLLVTASVYINSQNQLKQVPKKLVLYSPLTL